MQCGEDGPRGHFFCISAIKHRSTVNSAYFWCAREFHHKPSPMPISTCQRISILQLGRRYIARIVKSSEDIFLKNILGLIINLKEIIFKIHFFKTAVLKSSKMDLFWWVSRGCACFRGVKKRVFEANIKTVRILAHFDFRRNSQLFVITKSL